ncbi:unnamed protein product [Prunus armeniaca]
MKSLQKNGTWELVNLPIGKKPGRCRWIYTVKYKVDGTIEHFKTRLVAKDTLRHMAIDYMETIAPVAKINTRRNDKITGLIVYVDDIVVTGMTLMNEKL